MIRNFGMFILFFFFRLHVLASCNLISLLLPGIRPAETVSITYVDADGTEATVEAEISRLLDAAHDNNVKLEGACCWVLVLMATETVTGDVTWLLVT
jgi:hypothetical protein